MPDTHVWVTGAGRAGSAEAAQVLAPDVVVDCHRGLRGPYTGAGALLRSLVPRLHAADPELVAGHVIEILAVAPELEPLIGPAPGTLTSNAPQQERTRWYSHLRTRRIAHGIVDLLAELPVDGRLTLVFGAVDHADATDLEFLALALRRLDPARVSLVVCSRGETFDAGERPGEAGERPGEAGERPGEAGERLRDAVRERCRRVVVADPIRREGTVEEAAAAFIASDGTSDVPGEREAHLAMDPQVRMRHHDERADALLEGGEPTVALRAVPYHRGLGATADTAGRAAYRAAIDHCMGMAYYEAGLELADQLLTMIDAEAEPSEHYWAQTHKADFLVLLLRPALAEPIYYDLLSRSVRPYLHMIMSYALAMLYTRIYGPEQKDHHRARAHINTAIAFASLTRDPDEQAFHSVFMHNGKALVEMHLGNLPESLRLVSEGIERLDRELPPDRHHLHRSVLRHNRGQVYAALGRHDEALADFDHVIEADPHYPEYRFDRGNLLNRLGRHAAALTDYQVAMRLGPPFPELFYNIGDLHATMGDPETAMALFRRVLDLEPDYLDARVSLASLLLDEGEPKAAAEEARAGLAVSPDEARLHCTLGLALLDLADLDAARLAFDRAVELDPALVEARVNRAVVGCEQRRYDEAVADLTTVLGTDPGNPDVLFNRGYAYQAAGRLREAIVDYTLAMAQDGADHAAARYQRGRCHATLGNLTEARTDLEAHLALGPSPHEQEVGALLARW